MLLRVKAKQNDKRLDRVQRDLLQSVKVGDEEINAVAGSPDLYEGVRLRIANGPAQLAGAPLAFDRRRAAETSQANTGRPRWAGPSLRWALTAASILLLAGFAALLLLPKESSQSTEISEGVSQLVPSQPADVQPAGSRLTNPMIPEGGESDQLASNQLARSGTATGLAHRASTRHSRRDSRAGEVATEYFPLTYTEDSAAQESGQVVRVKIARTALIAFGLPMNVARAGELITADVVIGDDGLARAIRFIQ